MFPLQHTKVNTPTKTTYGHGIAEMAFCFLLFLVSTAIAAPIDTLSGKIVYQTPDGIYEISPEVKIPHRIADYGTNPRWSPDGKHIAFIHGNAIMLFSKKTDTIKRLATAGKAKSLCFFPDGKSVVFTDNKFLRLVEIANGKITTLLTGGPFYEVDMAAKGNRLAATVKTLTGYKVRVFDLENGSVRTVSRGCSASLSPDGNMITVNTKKHRILSLFNWENLKEVAQIHAPSGMQFDNQLWSNNPEWLSSTSEGDINNIFLHHISSDTSYQMTTSGDSDRADLFVITVQP